MGRSARAQAQARSLRGGGARDACEGMSTHSDLAGFRRPLQHTGLPSPKSCKPGYRQKAGTALPYSHSAHRERSILSF